MPAPEKNIPEKNASGQRPPAAAPFAVALASLLAGVCAGAPAAARSVGPAVHLLCRHVAVATCVAERDPDRNRACVAREYWRCVREFPPDASGR
ncbi:hypothetical protein ACFFJB_03785 [Camelimonas abortus]|uniref:Cysteine rich repeat protein n=1 Tax=Camelimonas abortus TaxID=1017184 RepID=A0ABV7LCJ2_9HYPH